MRLGATMLVLGLVVAAQAGGATFELLAKPCRAKNMLSSCIVRDRADGRERFAVSNMNEESGAEIIFIDFERNEAKVYRAPGGAGSWGLMEVPGDRLVMPTFYDGKFYVFDLKKMEFIASAGVPGETYIWNCAIGSDGRVYGGTYGGGKLGAIDLNTYRVEDLGAPAPPNMYLRAVSALPDGRILCSFGQEKPVVLIFDPRTEKFEPLPESMAGVSSGTTWHGLFLSGSKVFDGKTLEPVAPPFPTPPADKGSWAFHNKLTWKDAVFIAQNAAIYRWRKGEKDLTLIADIDLRGGGYCAATGKGDLIGLRGQDYFIVKPGDKALDPKPIPIELEPRQTHFLRADENGILWGGPTFGQTLFHMDPTTKQYVNTGCISNKGGEVYDVAFYKGVVYAAAYAGGEIIRYDPNQKWDQWNGRNPRTIANLGEKGYIRPIGTIQLGPDNKLYSGWMAKYGTYGGAVAITDPATEKTELIENPLGEQAIAGLAVGGGMIFAGTNLSGNGLPRKKGESPKFGVIDIATRKVTFEHTFEGTSSVRPLAYDPVSKKVVLSTGGLQSFDVTTRQFAPLDAPGVTSNSVGAPGDGKLYYGAHRSIVALDIRSGKHDTIVAAPGTVSNVAIDSQGSIYFSSGVDVYAVRK